ncbi:FAD:protein FMN transferase [Cellulosilyticum sp. I15G10I2]|uniref:FAD:protein FMN transferase n=1 Tax=Cellulosilyticum sp. I15G10I2 TaxID=1892843 RepID=UPI00085C5924|nr:FAD:protein FMN transferase [Cellulosilyticum sp. I15G10I2]
MVRKIIAFILMVILTMNFTACGSPKKTRYESEFLVLFNTVSKIVAYTESKEEFSKHSKFIYDSLKEYHELYDIYNDYEGKNNIKTINDHAGVKPIEVDKKIIDLLLFSKDQYKKTDGKVNIAFGAVLKIWHDYRTEGVEDFENAKLPPIDKLEAAKVHTDINKVIIDEVASTVFLEDPEMSLDVGAIAKGYAVEQVALLAMKNGFDAGLLSIGGNVRAIGNKGDPSKLWNVGVQNPEKESEDPLLKIVYLSDLSLVTSGNYERYYTVGDKNYHHIIDTDTLFPSEYLTAVTIICPDSGVADVLSTAVFNMPFEQGLEFIDSLPDTEALWILNNGEIKYSAHFKDLIKE